MSARVAIYARYSSDLQRSCSIEDQMRLCKEKAASQGWQIQNCYMDAEISGASLMRPGIQSLIQAAMNGAFEIVLCEALDRLSRDQEDIAGLYKRMAFAGVKIVTLSEGEINTMHIGLKGTMNALFLQDLADKTRRGLRGKVENGKSGGGISYGYKVVKQFTAQGEAIKGDREIDPQQADIIRRIFKEYAYCNKSPKAIAAQLNKEGIPGPSGKDWSQSTINGNRKRGTGILNNELYIGELVWNRQRFIKDPATGKRVTRMNDESLWIRQSVPELRIIPQELWELAKARQATLEHKKPAPGSSALWKSNRPRYLLSGLLKCGVCGGAYAKINTTHYGCAAAKNKGEAVCRNKINIRRDKLEKLVLSALQTRLMRDDLVQVFCEEYTRHLNELLKAKDAHLAHCRAELAKANKERDNLIQALKDGVPAALVKDDLERVSKRRDELEATLETGSRKPRPLLHPSMAEQYRREVRALQKSLNDEESRVEAAEHLRTLVEKIVLTPKAGREELSIDLYGDLAGILQMANCEENKDMKKPNILDRLGRISVNYTEPQALQDGIGSGGWI